MNENDSTGNRSAGGQSGLLPFYSLDGDCFDFERKHIFEQSWVPVGYASDLSSRGDYLCTEIAGIPCVAVVDGDGQKRLFENVCRHRGTRLCTEPAGRLKSAFACPYHGWKYDFAGQLVSAPNMQDVEGFDRSEWGLGGYALREWSGLLFATQQAGEIELPAARLERIAKLYQLDQCRRVETISYDVAANWKLIFQNFNECYHCPSVHPQLTPYSDYRESENEFERGAVLGGPMKIRPTAGTISRDGTCCGTLPSGLPAEEHDKARYFTVFPNLFISFFPDYVMVHRLTPASVGRTKIDCDFLFHPETIESPGFDASKASGFWDLTNRQDWEMCERVQQGIATPGFKPSPYSNLESLLVEFDRHYRGQLERLGFDKIPD